MSGAIERKKLWIAAAVAFVVLYGLEFVVHGLLLGPIYRKPHYLTLWNPEHVMMGRMPAMALAYAVASIVFAMIYAQGYEPSKSSVGQGLRCGLLLGTLVSTFHSLIDFAVYPVSWKLAAAWVAAGIAVFCVVGVVIALICTPKPAA